MRVGMTSRGSCPPCKRCIWLAWHDTTLGKVIQPHEYQLSTHTMIIWRPWSEAIESHFSSECAWESRNKYWKIYGLSGGFGIRLASFDGVALSSMSYSQTGVYGESMLSQQSSTHKRWILLQENDVLILCDSPLYICDKCHRRYSSLFKSEQTTTYSLLYASRVITTPGFFDGNESRKALSSTEPHRCLRAISVLRH
jgi:hypothetical protein